MQNLFNRCLGQKHRRALINVFLPDYHDEGQAEQHETANMMQFSFNPMLTEYNSVLMVPVANVYGQNTLKLIRCTMNMMSKIERFILIFIQPVYYDDCER